MFRKALVMNPCNVRVVDLRDQRELLQKAVHHLAAVFVAGRCNRQHLEHVLRLARFFLGEEYFGHAAFAELLLQLVAFDLDRRVWRARLGFAGHKAAAGLRAHRTLARRSNDGSIGRNRRADLIVKPRVRTGAG